MRKERQQSFKCKTTPFLTQEPVSGNRKSKKPNSSATRKTGYYWVRHACTLYIGSWNEKSKNWLLLGWSGAHGEDEITAVGPRILEPTKEF